MPYLYAGGIIIIIILAAIVCTRNYKNRGNNLNNNLLEYCLYIIEQYDILTNEDKQKLFSLLTDKESALLNKIIKNPHDLGRNLYMLQGQMMTLESIMGKIKSLKQQP